MRTKNYFLILLGSVSVLFGACVRVGDGQTLALVSGERISVGELRDVINRQAEIYSEDDLKGGKTFAKIKEKALEDLIHKKLIVQAAKEKGVGVSEEELEREISKFKSGYSEKDFQELLNRNRIDYHVWRALKKENLLVSKFVKNGFLGVAEVGEEEIKDYYEKHVKRWESPPSVHVRQIVTDTKEKAENIYERLMRGENFARLARNLSISPEKKLGGDLGYIPKGAYPEVYDVCFTMKPGEISPIIPSPYGFHLFKVLDSRPAEKKSLLEVREKIKAQLELEKNETKFKEYVSLLKKKAEIKIFIDVLRKVTL